MIHLSRWKVILLVTTLLFGLLFGYANLLSPAQREALPGWLPKNTLNLGLDLQGGSYLLLEVDVPAMREKKVTNLMEDVRTTLREARISTNNLQPEAGGVIVTVSDAGQYDAAFDALRTLAGNPGPNGVSERQVQRLSDNRIRFGFTDAILNSMSATAVDQSIEVVRRRVDKTGTKEISITRQGADRIVIQAPGESDPEALERIIGQTAQLTFQMVDIENSVDDALAGRIPPDSELMYGEDNTPYLVKRRVLVSGENLTQATVTSDQNNRPAIGFRFDGAVPAPLKVEERRTVTAELGADAVAAGQLSTIIGFVIIVVFMIGAYGLLFGGISVLGLILNGLLIIAAMSVTQATLTLPGIAGLVLTFAVAVDANVLIYERMRDEARAGRSVIASMDTGFSKAWGTIMDANVTTLVAAAIMFAFGAGPVRGFAWTLSIGVVTSMLSAILTAQVMLAFWLKVKKPKKLPIAE